MLRNATNRCEFIGYTVAVDAHPFLIWSPLQWNLVLFFHLDRSRSSFHALCFSYFLLLWQPSRLGCAGVVIEAAMIEEEVVGEMIG